MDMKRFFLYAIAIAALALAGCGGNGGGSGPVVDNGTGNGGGGTCPSGTTGTPPDNCVPITPPTPPTCAEDPMAANCTGATQAQLTTAAGTKTKAIMTEMDQMVDATLGGSARDGDDGTANTADDPYTLEISRDQDGTTIKITDFALADPKFAQAMDLGGGTTMHVRKMVADADGNVEDEVVIVTTDIGAPKATAFGMVAGQSLTVNALGNAATGTAAVGFDPGDALESTDTAQAAILANIKSDDFTAGSGQSAMLTFTQAIEDDSTTLDKDETRAAAEVMGYYNGAMGTYTCTGANACTVTADSMGKLTLMSNGWVFLPAAGATSDVQDTDYLHYGFWLARTSKDGVVTSYDEVETFAGSSLPVSGSVANVDGSATYSGDATGVYVKNVLTSSGALDSATSGHFTATANLTATFGQVENEANDGTIAVSMLNTLTGTISDFALAGGEANSWMAVLAGDIDMTDGSASGTAKGGSPAEDGSLSAQFHGAGTEENNVAPAPSAVVGEFNAFFTDGSVAGGFGARKDP